jgi:glucose/arabinose dehydrogenase
VKRIILTAALAIVCAAPACAGEPDGLILPPGFHASIVAEGLGPLRHLAVRPNGDLYASTGGEGGKPTGLIAIHLGPDHKSLQSEHFSTVNGGTGIRFYKGMLYATSDTTVYRFHFSGDALLPVGDPDVVVSGMTANGNRPIAFDDSGNLFVGLDGMGNLCTVPHAPAGTKPVGLKPCPELANRAGIWKFHADRTDQKFTDGTHFATGIRGMSALDWSAQGGGLYGAFHARDGSNHFWPDIFSAADDDNVGDEMHKIVSGADLGWPYSYYDTARHLRLVAPEYGGDGKTEVPAGVYSTPVATFSPRPAPLDLQFYNARQFPSPWRGGAFLALHGALGPPLEAGRAGFTVAFVPFDRYGHAGVPSVFADGFAGPSPADRNVGKAKYRPVGLAVAPDGALYVADSNVGRIWRITYGEP